INDEQFRVLAVKKAAVDEELKRIRSTRVKPGIVNPVLSRLGGTPVREDISLYQLLKRPEVKYAHIAEIAPPGNGISRDALNQVEIETKYGGYVSRQAEQAERFRKMAGKLIPAGFDYRGIPGLSREIIEKLEEVRPLNLGQAGRIPGVTPAAVSLLMIAVEKRRRS
ncbi:MAG: tRNA uridine-5-carboxymethylaminomethyl(34) synthesis enzyme MnmG, partial [Nitrospiraceae bacterium]